MSTLVIVIIAVVAMALFAVATVVSIQAIPLVLVVIQWAGGRVAVHLSAYPRLTKAIALLAAGLRGGQCVWLIKLTTYDLFQRGGVSKGHALLVFAVMASLVATGTIRRMCARALMGPTKQARDVDGVVLLLRSFVVDGMEPDEMETWALGVEAVALEEDIATVCSPLGPLVAFGRLNGAPELGFERVRVETSDLLTIA